jgi:hypothetical protein
VLRFNREIRDDDLSAGHEHARELLRKTGTHALLWGEVLKKSVPRLYWTSQAENAAKDTSENYQPAGDFTLPEIFWDDLKQVLNLVVATAAENFAVLEGQYSADRLKPFVGQVRELLKRGTQRQWDSSTLAPIRIAFGDALSSEGKISRNRTRVRPARPIFITFDVARQGHGLLWVNRPATITSLMKPSSLIAAP